ncbi:RNA polymerase sigma factor (sigma-70 family) [Streptomyces cavourensis]|nr:RNA polymerase sigma factor (sigma-70 family) [Streptomyces cavourensis]
MGITRFKIADALDQRSRRRRDLQAVSAAKVEETLADEATPNRVVDQLMVREFLAQLSDSQRQVLEMTFFDDLTQAQIAERTGLPLGTVKTHARRGLIALKRRMEEVEGAAH